MTTTVAAIGLGLLGRIECRAYQSIDDVELVAGADVSPDARETFENEFDVPTYEDYETLLDEHAAEIDAVNVVTPHTLHYEHASACLERDLHVFLEKPLTTDFDDAVSLVEESNRRDLVLQVGYQRHFDPVFQEIKRVAPPRHAAVDARRRPGRRHGDDRRSGERRRRQQRADRHAGPRRRPDPLDGRGERRR